MNILNSAPKHRQEFLSKASLDNLNLYLLSDGLEVLAETQRLMAERARPAGDTAMEEFRVYALALIVELSELLQELPWKPWKPGGEIDTQKVAHEVADILAFFGHLLRILQDEEIVGAFDLAKAYKEKSQINLSRFDGNIIEYKFD